MVELRAARSEDWQAILAAANAALPDAEAECQEWLDNRIAFDEDTHKRRHYVAHLIGEGIVTYGAVEQGPEPHLYRMFIVAEPRLVDQSVAEKLYEKLMSDLKGLGAQIVWAREEVRDPILPFFYQKGFQERTRFMLDSGREAVVLYLELDS